MNETSPNNEGAYSQDKIDAMLRGDGAAHEIGSDVGTDKFIKKWADKLVQDECRQAVGTISNYIQEHQKELDELKTDELKGFLVKDFFALHDKTKPDAEGKYTIEDVNQLIEYYEVISGQRLEL